jgi:hypothetical protein
MKLGKSFHVYHPADFAKFSNELGHGFGSLTSDLKK